MVNDFFDQFIRHVRERSGEVVLQTIREDERESITYGDMMRAVRCVSAAVSSAGIKPGDRVAMIMESDHHWVLALLGLAGAGAVSVPLDPSQTADKLSATLAHADCRLLISSKQFANTLCAVRQALPDLPMILRSNVAHDHSPCLSGSQHWEELLEKETSAGGAWPLVSHDPDADFLLVYTGGTTGTPKGVRLSLRALLVCIQDTTKIFPLSARDHILSILPLFHIMATQASVLGPLYRGARITYLLSRDPRRIVTCFRAEAITAFLCVPLFYYQIRRRIFEQVALQSPPKKFLFYRLLRLSGWLRRSLGINAGKLLLRSMHSEFGPAFRGFGVGGARFAPQIAEDLHDLGFAFFQGYGMTETAALTSLTPMSMDGGLSCGHALDRAEIAIDSPSANGIGEVKVRGPHLMSGYWRDDQASTEMLREGWLWTGDLGYLDDGQRLHITGRKKEVIVLSSGKNVFPEPLEQHYQSACSYVAELCIFGLIGPRQAGEHLHAVIVPDFDALATSGVVNVREAILYQLQSAGKKLPVHERLLGFDVRKGPLPRTSARKLQRFRIAEEREPISPAAAPIGPERATTSAANEGVLEIIHRMKSIQRVELTMHLELDLGFDSLERIELFTNVESRFGVSLPDAESARIFTVRQLIEAVGGGASPSMGGESTWRSWGHILNAPLTQEESKLAEHYLSGRPLFAPILFVISRLFCLLTAMLLRFRFEAPREWPSAYPFVIAANHQSYLDTPLLMGNLPYRLFQRTFFLSTSRLHRTAFQIWFGRSARAIPIDPDRHLATALRLAAEGLRRGLVLCVFPEGHRTMNGEIQPFRKGLSILAAEKRIAVMPVGIKGSGKVWGRGSRGLRLAPITIRVGPILTPALGVAADDFNAELLAAISSLLHDSEASLHGPG